MLVKTFQAESMPEALKLVKTAFGSDAMILSSKEGRKRGLLGLTKKPFAEVTAAFQPAERPLAEPAPRQEREFMPSAKEEFQNAMLVPIAREMKVLREQVDMLVRKGQEKQAAPQAKPVEQQDMDDAFVRQAEGDERAEAFLKVFRQAARPNRPEAVQLQPLPEVDTAPGSVERLASLLLANGVLPEVAEKFVRPLKESQSATATESALRKQLVENIGSHVTCTGPLKIREHGPRVLALIGPTGVGKTTTIAKLAAFAFKKGAKVVLVTIDTFRVGAVEQLKTYSQIMGVPLEVAATPRELAHIIDSHGDKDLIFIDTAGRSPRDLEHLREMKGFLQSSPDIETHLCLAVTTRDRELEEAVQAFGELPVDRVLFTKLDESSSFGCMANVLMKSRYPLSYFTTGQRVPQDVEVATINKFTELILKGA